LWKKFENTLYNNSAKSMSEEELKEFRLSGGLFAVEHGVQGVPNIFF